MSAAGASTGPRPLPVRPRVAVVGSGISGLAAAWALRESADVVLYEADDRPGGHAHTVDLTLDGIRHGVDTGFLVFNHATYPQLVRLFEQLQVPTAASDMSFSVQAPGAAGATALEWSGHDLDSVFAQRRNLLRPRFWGMLADLLRFNRETTALATAPVPDGRQQAALAMPLGEYLQTGRYGAAFRDDYLLPMLGCIWSCPTEQMLRFPVATMVRFCHNHGLIRVRQRPQWYTVSGGSREYVRRMVAALPDVRTGCPVQALRREIDGVTLLTPQGPQRHDAVVLACHSDQALRLLGEGAAADERALLGAIGYHRNRAVLHTDVRQLPQRRKTWAAWNYERAAHAGTEQGAVCLHYLINRLQPLPWAQPVVVSLNPVREIDGACIHGEFDYAHPVFDAAAIAAQRRLPQIQGRDRIWFAGAWTGYGFHEDGLRSGLEAAEGVRAVCTPDPAAAGPRGERMVAPALPVATSALAGAQAAHAGV
ncbi:MAG: hypothetical protein RL223_35 [Pseudomonadota bacterium]|jgi:predicted NAD/FAD-binding protein